MGITLYNVRESKMRMKIERGDLLNLFTGSGHYT